jgi:hypothetical protein
MSEESSVIKAHPMIVLGGIQARYGTKLELTFSRYKVGPPGEQEERRRRALHIDIDRATGAWLRSSLLELGCDEELALHSKVNLGGASFHIPMIDYDRDLPIPQLRDLGLRAIKRTDYWLPPAFLGPARLYSFRTGRSYHQYADVLIPERAWLGYLGNILLLNHRSELPVVDTRWVGHSLRRGYSALRWSHKTTRYVSEPTLVDEALCTPLGESAAVSF